MFRPRTDADETSRQLSQNRKPFQQADYKRQRLFVAGRSTGDNSPMNKNLHSLYQARRPFASRLYFSQIVHGNWTTPQFLREQIRRRYRILDSEVNPDSARGRHGMRRIADAE